MSSQAIEPLSQTSIPGPPLQLRPLQPYTPPETEQTITAAWRRDLNDLYESHSADETTCHWSHEKVANRVTQSEPTDSSFLGKGFS